MLLGILGLVLCAHGTEIKSFTDDGVSPELPRFQQAQLTLTNNLEGVQVDAAQNAQLLLGLEQIKQDIIIKSRDLREEITWVDEVGTIIAEYNAKLVRVKADIAKNRIEIKEMLKKRRQIENLKLQKQLESKLKDANGDLDTLDSALNSVQSKSDAFKQNKGDVEATVKALTAQLAILKGTGASGGASGAAKAPA